MTTKQLTNTTNVETEFKLGQFGAGLLTRPNGN